VDGMSITRHVIVTGYEAPRSVDAWECLLGHRISVPADLERVPKIITCTYPDPRSYMQCGQQMRLRKARAVAAID
jgi:hypothetical protein